VAHSCEHGDEHVTFEVFTVVTAKNAVFWDEMLCGTYKNRHFRGTYHLHHQDRKNQQARNNIRSLILSTLMMEAIRSSETSGLTRTTWCHIPGEDILHGDET
jgi:hypothetical protein